MKSRRKMDAAVRVERDPGQMKTEQREAARYYIQAEFGFMEELGRREK